jgi:hypothetical protein
MRNLYDWEVTGDLDTDRAMKTIFHPNLYQFYLKDKVKDIKNLRIEIVPSKHFNIIRFLETDKGDCKCEKKK